MVSVPLPVIFSWPAPNYVNPIRRGPTIWVVSGIFLFLATCLVSLRVWTRITVRRFVGGDDFLVIFALLCSAAVAGLNAVGIDRYDWDRHLWDISLSHVPGAVKILYASRLCWLAATTAVRLSVLLLYYRLLYACQASRRYYVVLHIITAFNVGMFSAFTLTSIFPCSPVHAYWDWQMMNPKCMNDGACMMTSAILNTFSEFIIATLPLLATFFLRVDKRQRWNVIALLSLGFFVAIAGCVRSVYLWKALSTYDYTWWASPQWICAQVEIDVALICASAAPLSPHLARLSRRLRGLPLPPRLRRSRKSVVIVKNTNYSRDYRAVAEWTAMMSRTIDIEGIANDGYGYSVTITGPISPVQQPRRTPSRLRKSANPRFLQTEEKKYIERKSAGWQIPVEILEPDDSLGSTVFNKLECGERNACATPSTTTFDNAEIVLDTFSDPTVLNPTPHVPQEDSESIGATTTNNHMYSFYQEAESAETLPNAPSPSRHGQKRAGVLELIRHPPFRRPER